MTFSATLVEDVASRRPGWTSHRWAPPLMAVAVLVLVVAPARVWLLAAAAPVGDTAADGNLRALWTFAGLLPLTVGVLAWALLRSRPAGRRFVLAALWACPVGLLTMLPILTYVVAI